LMTIGSSAKAASGVAETAKAITPSSKFVTFTVSPPYENFFVNKIISLLRWRILQGLLPTNIVEIHSPPRLTKMARASLSEANANRPFTAWS